MKKPILTLIALVALMAQAIGQEIPPPPDERTRERIDAARAAFLTERLDLSADQAQRFWPVYNEFNKKRQELRKTFMEARRSQSTQATPEEQRKLLELGMNLRQQELDLEKSYADRFLQVITADQMLRLHSGERDFQQMVIKHLLDRRGEKGPGGTEPRRGPGPPQNRRPRHY